MASSPFPHSNGRLGRVIDKSDALAFQSAVEARNAIVYRSCCACYSILSPENAPYVQIWCSKVADYGQFDRAKVLHNWCRECLTTVFKLAADGVTAMPVRCCENEIDISLLEEVTWMKLQELCRQKREEEQQAWAESGLSLTSPLSTASSVLSRTWAALSRTWSTAHLRQDAPASSTRYDWTSLSVKFDGEISSADFLKLLTRYQERKAELDSLYKLFCANPRCAKLIPDRYVMEAAESTSSGFTTVDLEVTEKEKQRSIDPELFRDAMRYADTHDHVLLIFPLRQALGLIDGPSHAQRKIASLGELNVAMGEIDTSLLANGEASFHSRVLLSKIHAAHEAVIAAIRATAAPAIFGAAGFSKSSINLDYDDTINNTGFCPACRTRTCVLCRALAHPNQPCARDTSRDEILALGREQGWKECHGCKRMVEWSGGCTRVNCQCGSVIDFAIQRSRPSKTEQSRKRWDFADEWVDEDSEFER